MFFRKILVILLLVSLGSCGFRVIYDDRAGESFTNELAAIKIQKKRDRSYQILKNKLYDIFNPEQVDVEAKYILVLDISESIYSTYTTNTGSSGRNKVSLDINYILKNKKDGLEISSGSLNISDDYDVSDNRYATYSSEEYVKSNLLGVAAQDIRNSIVNGLIEANQDL